MGCMSSKSVDTAVAAGEPYLPSPTSVALFDINTIEEPWLMIKAKTLDIEDHEKQEQKDDEILKPTNHITLPLLEKLENNYDNNIAPQYSWSDVSKALQDLKPSLEQQKTQPPTSKIKKQNQEPAAAPPPPTVVRPVELSGIRAVKENSFIIQDRLQRQGKEATEANMAKFRRRSPLEGYEEKPPPGNSDGVVLYTTTLRGVRRTFEDCERARKTVELNAVDVGIGVDERDVSLHGEFLKELRELVGESEGVVPRLFVMGRYVGGVEEMMEVNESGKLREMMKWVKRKGGEKVEGGGRVECEGCGGARFVPCLECSGSCKVVGGEDGKEVVRCGNCNENGLELCPLCH